MPVWVVWTWPVMHYYYLVADSSTHFWVSQPRLFSGCS